MQGKYVIFLILLTLATGSFSSLKAQEIDAWVEPETFESLFAECPMELNILIQEDIILMNTARHVVTINCTGAAKYANLPESVELTNGKVTIPFTIGKMPESVHGTEGTITVSMREQSDFDKKLTYVFYNPPTYELTYIKPTTTFSGTLELKIEGGSPHMLRQWKDGGEPVDARKPFSELEIANSSEGDVLLLWEPNSCWSFSIPLVASNNGGSEPGGPTISRPVTIPVLTNAKTKPAAGVYQVTSNTNFTFEVIPHADVEEQVLVVTTDRNIPDEEGLKVECNEDGSYTVTILRVQTATNVSIGFATVENVLIPVLTNAETIPAAGIHPVIGNTDFSFKIIPHAGNEELVPVVTTGRNIPDEEDVKIEPNEDGSYTVTILKVQTAINIGIDFTVGLGNEFVPVQKVWASNEKLYISSVVDGNAKVYSITGQLVKTVWLSSGGTTEVSLSKGLYIVVVNDQKAYKVIVK